MIDSVVVATDGSESVRRCVAVAVDLAARFDAAVHALYVVDEREIDAAPERLRDELRTAHEAEAREALDDVAGAADGAGVAGEVTTAVERGRPADAVVDYAREVDADVVATGTRGRHGEHRFLLGSVAERVVRRCPAPVLTVRQLEPDEAATAG